MNNKLTQSDLLNIVNKVYNLKLTHDEVTIESGELQQISELYAPYIEYRIVNQSPMDLLTISDYDNYTLYTVIQKFGTDDILCKQGHFKPDNVYITVYRYSLTGKRNINCKYLKENNYE